MMGFLMDRMMHMYKCAGREGDCDKYEVGFAFPPKWLPIPVQQSINMDITTWVDDDGLLKAETMSETVKSAKMDMNMSMTMKFNQSSLGGPSADELVPPTSWNCAPVDSEEPFFDDWSRFAVGRSRLIPKMIETAKQEMSHILVV